jgi:hypothetical protein
MMSWFGGQNFRRLAHILEYFLLFDFWGYFTAMLIVGVVRELG